MEKDTPSQPSVENNSTPTIRSEFVEPQLTELGNLREMTGLSFSAPPGGGPI